MAAPVLAAGAVAASGAAEASATSLAGEAGASSLGAQAGGSGGSSAGGATGDLGMRSLGAAGRAQTPYLRDNGPMRQLLAVAAVGLLFVLLIPVLLVTSIPGGGRTPTEEIGSGSPIPAGLVPVFNAASRAFDVNPYLLASVADQESTFGSGTAWTQVNSAGCVGFMQICIGGAGGDTWDETVSLTSSPRAAVRVKDAYRYAPRPSSYSLQAAVHPDYNDPFDAVMSAAVVLRGKVGGRPIPNLDDVAHAAACGYYGACADSVANYAQTVLSRAQLWESESALTTSESLLNVPAGSKLAQLVSVATQIGQMRIPYCWGGGHGASPGPSPGSYCHSVTNAHIVGDLEPGLDCSGSIRWLLVTLGYTDPGGISSGDFGHWLARGPGRWVNVYYNAEHTYMTIAGHPWGTSDHNYRGGPAWIPRPEDPSGYSIAHPAGL